MRRRTVQWRFVLVLATGFALAGCEMWESLIDPGRSSQQDTIVLHQGQSAWFAKGGLFLTFEKVVQDSRCPTGAVCVWAGDGEVQLSVRKGGGVILDCRLHTMLDPKFIETDGWRISLKKLDPYPVLGTQIDPATYEATLEIKPAGGGE